MKHLETRQKRKAQRRRANLEAIAFIAFVLMIGILLGSAVTAQTEETDKTEPVEARVVQYDPPPTPMPEVDVSEMETTTPRYALTVSERDIVERVVMAEAGGEGFDGQRLVAQCILNTSEAMDLRPDEVVLAPTSTPAPQPRPAKKSRTLCPRYLTLATWRRTSRFGGSTMINWFIQSGMRERDL